jgi:hypothetical protein
MLDGQVGSLEKGITRTAPSEVGCREANPPELILQEIKEFSRATFAPKDSRKIDIEDCLARSSRIVPSGVSDK